ncbi:MAG: phosphopantetheine adenylyltransferase [Thermoprotei archaeon]
MACFDRVVIGGTFDYLHKGHRFLLGIAFIVGNNVTIGLTTDDFAKKNKVLANNYSSRRLALINFLNGAGFNGRYSIVPISDPIGPAIDDFDAIIVSEESFKGAQLVDEARTEKGKKKLIKVVVPMVLAYDKKPISSTRIRLGEIDEEGHRLE